MCGDWLIQLEERIDEIHQENAEVLVIGLNSGSQSIPIEETWAFVTGYIGGPYSGHYISGTNPGFDPPGGWRMPYHMVIDLEDMTVLAHDGEDVFDYLTWDEIMAAIKGANQ